MYSHDNVNMCNSYPIIITIRNLCYISNLNLVDNSSKYLRFFVFVFMAAADDNGPVSHWHIIHLGEIFQTK